MAISHKPCGPLGALVCGSVLLVSISYGPGWEPGVHNLALGVDIIVASLSGQYHPW